MELLNMEGSMSYEVLVDSKKSPVGLQGHINETLSGRGVEKIHSVSFLGKGDKNSGQILYSGSGSDEYPYDKFSVLCLAGPKSSLEHDLDQQLLKQKSGSPSRVPEAFDWDFEYDRARIMVAMTPEQLTGQEANYFYRAKFWEADTICALKVKVLNWLRNNTDPDADIVDIVYSSRYGQYRACAIFGTSKHGNS
jgi:hypothetical protein